MNKYDVSDKVSIVVTITEVHEMADGRVFYSAQVGSSTVLLNENMLCEPVSREGDKIIPGDIVKHSSGNLGLVTFAEDEDMYCDVVDCQGLTAQWEKSCCERTGKYTESLQAILPRISKLN